MSIFALEIWYDEASICTFYTVRKIVGSSSDSFSEADSFFETYTERENPFQEQAFQLFHLITESIGNKYGAIDDFFDRTENYAQALPPKPKQRVEEIKNLGINFPLRLFCLRITEKIVVLFNGGIKNAENAQQSDLSGKFFEAQEFAKRILQALYDKTIEISEDERYLKYFDEINNIIL